jgi:AmiR/NasT family two-component response regulator
MSDGGCTAGCPVVRWLLVAGGDADEQLANARTEVAAATAHAAQLQRALVSNRRIGMAMGILMERHRFTEEQAFDQLRDLSQRSNVKLRDVAEQLIYTGDTQQCRD